MTIEIHACPMCAALSTRKYRHMYSHSQEICPGCYIEKSLEGSSFLKLPLMQNSMLQFCHFMDTLQKLAGIPALSTERVMECDHTLQVMAALGWHVLDEGLIDGVLYCLISDDRPIGLRVDPGPWICLSVSLIDSTSETDIHEFIADGLTIGCDIINFKNSLWPSVAGSEWDRLNAIHHDWCAGYHAVALTYEMWSLLMNEDSRNESCEYYGEKVPAFVSDWQLDIPF